MTNKIIKNGVDVSGCYLYKGSSKEYSCTLSPAKFHYRYCEENPNCDYKQRKRKEETINQIEKIVEKHQTDLEKDALSLPTAIESIIERKEREYKAATSEIKYLKKCCEQAGLELAKNSFDWDCKEKNLVVQAMELNEKYGAEKDKVKELEERNEKLKIQLIQKDEINTFFNTPIEGWSNDPCAICRYKQALEEIKEIAKTCINSDTCFVYKYSDSCFDKEISMKEGYNTYDVCKLILKKCEVLEDVPCLNGL